MKILTVYVKNLLLLVGDGDTILSPSHWIKIAIDKLEIEYSDEITSGIMQLIYKRYKNALDILEKNKDINRMIIIGGARAYMDSYNDYNNPILDELYKTEKLIKNLYESECKINNK